MLKNRDWAKNQQAKQDSHTPASTQVHFLFKIVSPSIKKNIKRTTSEFAWIYLYTGVYPPSIQTSDIEPKCQTSNAKGSAFRRSPEKWCKASANIRLAALKGCLKRCPWVSHPQGFLWYHLFIKRTSIYIYTHQIITYTYNCIYIESMSLFHVIINNVVKTWSTQNQADLLTGSEQSVLHLHNITVV